MVAPERNRGWPGGWALITQVSLYFKPFMTLSRSIIAAVFTLALAVAFVPTFASAQTYSCTTPNNNWSFWGTNNTTCAPGRLLVYVQVNNNINNGYNRVPSDFTVAVSGINASPSSFPGSISGTQVTVGGSYSVVALQLQGYTASYSTGCTGTINQNEQALCVVTESNTSFYNQYPTPYNYNGYYNQPLTCSPANQTVNLGQSVTFVANGGDYSQYNWQTPQRSFLNIGQTLNTTFPQTGTQQVTVTNGGTTATCTVTVVASGAPAPIVITPTTYNGYGYTTGSTYGGVYVTPTYVPRFPNTGFEPMSSAAAASAVAVLVALALVATPYVKKAFAAVLS